MEEPGVLIMVSFTMQLLTTVVSTPVNWKFFYQYANETSIVIHGGELVEGVEDQTVLPDHDGSHQGTHGQHVVRLKITDISPANSLAVVIDMNHHPKLWGPKEGITSLISSCFWAKA